jgi:sugar O-acyltransferase (sialic acid O-acetyltransferase NeuD family)
MKQLYIFGTSGFAREVRDVGEDLGFQCVFIAASAAERDQWTGDEPVIVEADLDPADGDSFAIGIGDNKIRGKIAEKYASRLHFPNLIHPSASFGSGQLGRIAGRSGIIVCAGGRFTNGIDVGDFAIFNLNCTVGHDCAIGNFVNVAPGANLSGYVTIEDYCWVGTNAAINQGEPGRPLTIGRGTVIGSGSVVVKDCEPDGVYVGIPAKRR